MGPDKSPGPNGLSPRFLQANWAMVKTDLVNAFKDALNSGEIRKSWLSSYITLIPKEDGADTPKKFRPITVGNITYRLLMKVITN